MSACQKIPPPPPGAEKGAVGAISPCRSQQMRRGENRSTRTLVGDVLGGPGELAGLHGGDAERSRGERRRLGGLALDGAA